MMVTFVKQEHGVDKIYKLEPGKSLSECEKYVISTLNMLANTPVFSVQAVTEY